MTVFLVTMTFDDGRSVIIGVYANDALAQATATRLRAFREPDENVQVFVTETDVIGS